MDRSMRGRRRPWAYRPGNESLEDRRLLSGGTWPPYIPRAELRALLHQGTPAVRPNTPVLPYGVAAKVATYVDPTARIVNGYAVIVGSPGFIGPYATLDAHGGLIQVGNSSVILDNAAIVANTVHAGTAPAPEARIGSFVYVGYGATIQGPSTVSSYDATRPTSIGPGAVIDGATIQQGAIVSALARVGPGVTVPSGIRVLPGADVATDAEASDPALGKVVAATSSDLSDVTKQLTNNLLLAQGYVTLYQGQSATGVSAGVPTTVSGIYYGNLAAVSGVSRQPGSPTASTAFLPPGKGAQFPRPRGGLAQSTLYNFHARVTGQALFHQRARAVQANSGRGVAIRADQGQPITIGSIAGLGNGVTINSPGGGALTIGQAFTAGNKATILGDGTRTAVIGDNVSIGSGAVVSGSSLGSGTTVGDRAYVLNSTFPANSRIPAGAIYINNALVGTVQW
ncbi:Bacterial transferase hexapeptide (six repeats) [Aquisphaera giovannonii]|uniref:Bacterial transferase hexapeptide (Six repeats) n=1 Tax=Aquisphaera giovannonii TaxID=406548 RepID=A0A5B9W3E8_9BACT|nr:carbonic anhydrase/acetyltransferase [Aquisphaera giovannonii]QEH35136.1 Bacterial transferase hexapeptide (six repeats) [Aquisphaera giovannonii]